MKDQNVPKWNVARLLSTLSEQLSADAPALIWVACSGGLDSMLLVRILRLVQEELKSFELGILHVNFALRGAESDGDEALVRRAAEQIACKLRVLRVDPVQHPKDGHGIQDWARKLRYSWFKENTEPSDWIAIAHHADDLAENILLRLCRGHNLGSLQGMRTLHKGYWRPLLALGRADLERMAETLRLEWREDSSNMQANYTRNQLRLNILPTLERLFPGVQENLRQHARDVEDCLILAQKQLPKLPIGLTLSLAEDVFVSSAFLARQRILDFLQSHNSGLKLRRELLIGLHASLVAGESKIWALAPSLRVESRAGTLTVLPAADTQSPRWMQYRERLLSEESEEWPMNSEAFEPSE